MLATNLVAYTSKKKISENGADMRTTRHREIPWEKVSIQELILLAAAVTKQRCERVKLLGFFDALSSVYSWKLQFRYAVREKSSISWV